MKFSRKSERRIKYIDGAEPFGAECRACGGGGRGTPSRNI